MKKKEGRKLFPLAQALHLDQFYWGHGAKVFVKSDFFVPAQTISGSGLYFHIVTRTTIRAIRTETTRTLIKPK